MSNLKKLLADTLPQKLSAFAPQIQRYLTNEETITFLGYIIGCLPTDISLPLFTTFDIAKEGKNS